MVLGPDNEGDYILVEGDRPVLLSHVYADSDEFMGHLEKMFGGMDNFRTTYLEPMKDELDLEDVLPGIKLWTENE